MYLCRIQGMSKIHSPTRRGVPPSAPVHTRGFLPSLSWRYGQFYFGWRVVKGAQIIFRRLFVFTPPIPALDINVLATTKRISAQRFACLSMVFTRIQQFRACCELTRFCLVPPVGFTCNSEANRIFSRWPCSLHPSLSALATARN